jgi:hypothetical protein
MFLGRLPVRGLAEAEAYVDKVLAYAQASGQAAEGWQESALFVADHEEDFDAISERLLAQLPAHYIRQRVYGDSYATPVEAKPDILAAIDQGTLLVNFIGHGTLTGWSWDSIRYEPFLEGKDFDLLNNGPRYPFLVTGDCYNGLFAHPTGNALAERFVVLAGKGGIGAWSPTGLSYSLWHEMLIKALYATIFEGESYQLGPATTTAKLTAFAQLGQAEPVEIFTLLGDPALALAVVQSANTPLYLPLIRQTAD